ncbi:MAG: penicillin-binding protein 2 [Patescibacteria group bacterium]
MSIKLKVKRKFKEDIEPEEIFMDSKRLKQYSGSEREKIEKPIEQIVLKVFFAFVFLILFSLFLKSFSVQIIKGEYWRNLADENRIRSYPIKALRGIIYDKNKEPLAINVPRLDLVIIPADLNKSREYKEILEKLSGLLDIEKSEIEKKILDNSNLSYPIIIKENIEREKALLLESEFSENPFVLIRKESRRQYETGFSHLLGYLNKANEQETDQGYLVDEYVGRTGLEQVYESLLKGENGEELVEIDNLGRTQDVLAAKNPKHGKDLILSIDAGLQKQLYSALKSTLNNLSTSKAAAIVLNPKNGKILALVSFPDFDNTNLSEEMFIDSNQPLFNRVISGTYAPGSTIKPLIAAAALQENVIINQLTCPGYLSVPDKYNPGVFWTFNDWKVHGTVDLIKAIAESCNVYFYTLGGGSGDFEGLGIDRIAKYLRLFNFGEKLGIILPGESSGLIPSAEWKQETKKEAWYTGDTYNTSIGQGDVSTTPLQVAIATAAIANNGIIFQPQLVENQKTKIIRKGFIEEKHLETVRKGMREAVISGSARFLSDLPVQVAGKTGTAETFKGKEYHAWFTGFAPYSDPEIVITILIENGGQGSAISVPVAKQVLNWYFSQ